jgi:lipopolysaccharide transport system ATP-binding protein
LLRDDSPDTVLDYYNAVIAAQRAEYEIRQSEIGSGRTMTRSGTAEASIEAVELLTSGRPANAVRSGDAAVVRIAIKTHAALPELTVGLLIRDRLGNDVFGTNTYHLDASRTGVVAGEWMTVDFTFPALELGVGSYSVTAALHERDTHLTSNYDWWDQAVVFQVVRGNGPVTIGVCAFPVSVRWRFPGKDEDATPDSATLHDLEQMPRL